MKEDNSNGPWVNKPYLSVAEAALRAGCSSKTIRRDIAAHRIAVHRPGGLRGRIRISQADFLAYMARGRIPAIGEEKTRGTP